MARRRVSPEPFEVQIDSLDRQGRGRAAHNDRTLLVHGALPGESVRVKNLFGRRFRNQAEVLDVLEAAPERVTPPCPSFGACSACSLQHLAEAEQLAFKQKHLLSLLQESGGLRPERVLPPLSGARWSYRRKARLSVRDVPAKGRVLVGFRERDARFVMDMQTCHTLATPIADALPQLSRLLGSLDARSQIPQLEASCGDEQAALVLRHMEPLSAADQERLQRFELATGLRLYLQPKGPDTVHPLTSGPSQLRYALPAFDLEFRFEPLDFVQVNGSMNQLMIQQALELLALKPEHRVLDLFCGLGNFTLPLARQAGSVLGLEGSEELVARGLENARHNGLDQVSFRAVDLYGEQLQAQWPNETFDAVLLDPPRSGAEAVLPLIAATGASKLLYVSCNPETLASDAALLVRDHGYRLSAAGAMDMFPQTTHIEAMALFTRSGETVGGA